MESVGLLHQKHHTSFCSFLPEPVCSPPFPFVPIGFPHAGGQHKKGARAGIWVRVEQLLTWQKEKWLEQLFHLLWLLKHKGAEESSLKWPYVPRPCNMGHVKWTREIKAIRKYNWHMKKRWVFYQQLFSAVTLPAPACIDWYIMHNDRLN